MSLFHTASVPDIVNSINACAWLNVDVTAKDVVSVLNKYSCLSCTLSKMNRPIPSGSGVKPSTLGQWLSMDFVLVKRPVVSSQGYIGWFQFIELYSGYEIPVLTRPKMLQIS
jgi:hypothetical protein